MQKNQTYKEAILSTLQCLDDAEGHVMSSVVNLALSGVYKELDNLYETGEILRVEPAMFRETGDANIDLILKLVEDISNTKERIRNLNII